LGPLRLFDIAPAEFSADDMKAVLIETPEIRETNHHTVKIDVFRELNREPWRFKQQIAVWFPPRNSALKLLVVIVVVRFRPRR
jgi:hypothetical protein